MRRRELEAQARQLQARANQPDVERGLLKGESDARLQSVLSGQLTNWDCLDVKLEIGIAEKSTQFACGDPSKEPYLKHNWSHDSSAITDDVVLSNFKETANTPPGEGACFNHSAFRAALGPEHGP